ncbi:hypothetical protein COO60DRAFT_664343 [Scenedesmus sp. NREL 46B-D3]|nr:hypothetical protein COO60DRAFT_664343 [Scenedesmus sp. NREL 46B-D3]
MRVTSTWSTEALPWSYLLLLLRLLLMMVAAGLLLVSTCTAFCAGPLATSTEDGAPGFKVGNCTEPSSEGPDSTAAALVAAAAAALAAACAAAAAACRADASASTACVAVSRCSAAGCVVLACGGPARSDSCSL